MAPTKPARLLTDAPIASLTNLCRIAAFPTHEVWSGRAADGRRILLTTYAFASDAERIAVDRDVAALGDHPSNGLLAIRDVGEAEPYGYGPPLPAVVTERRVRALDLDSTPRAWPAIHAVIDRALVSLIELHDRGLLHGALDANAFGWFEEPDGHCVQKLAIPRRESTLGRTSPAGPLRNPAPEQIRSPRFASVAADLFALGCLAMRASASTPLPVPLLQPKDNRSTRVELPSFTPSCSLPGAYWGWLSRMTAIDPSLRFATAKEAREALPGATREDGRSADWSPSETGAQPVAKVPRETDEQSTVE